MSEPWAVEKARALVPLLDRYRKDVDTSEIVDRIAAALVAAKEEGRNTPLLTETTILLIEEARAEGRDAGLEEAAHDAAQGIFQGIFGQGLAIAIRGYKSALRGGKEVGAKIVTADIPKDEIALITRKAGGELEGVILKDVALRGGKGKP